jgi:maleylpyruvate isomerase
MDGAALAGAIAASHARVVSALDALPDDELVAPSRLPDWNRLTVVCHIRYGATAVDRMVRAAVAGEPALFYPGGRAEQRPGTLVPLPGESPRDVVSSFAGACAALDTTLAEVRDWSAVFREPEGVVDIGPQTVFQLAVLRLTEVDVHAVDLDVGIEHWSDAFVEVGLPLRLDRLGKRLSNNPSGERVTGTWLLRERGDGAHVVTATGDGVSTRDASPDEDADGVITASRRDLIALMLGRDFEGDVEFSNDFARSFTSAFPGP